MTLGEKLQTLRKEQGLSQEALAAKVNVTRQTISKWELNQSTPDLALLAQLSDLFHVSTDCLIRNERTVPEELPAKKTRFSFTAAAKHTLLTALSLLALTAAAICLICDHFTSGHLSWSLIAAASIAAAWLILLPVLAAKDKILCKTLWILCLVPFPLLAVLAALLKIPALFTLGSCITLLCIPVLWLLYWFFQKFHARLWCAFGCSLLVIVPLPIAILYCISRFLPQYPVDFSSTLFNSGITVILALVCFALDHRHRQKGATKP